MADLIFTNPKHKKIAEEALGFKFPGKYVTLPTMEEITWLQERIDERIMSEQLGGSYGTT